MMFPAVVPLGYWRDPLPGRVAPPRKGGAMLDPWGQCDGCGTGPAQMTPRHRSQGGRYGIDGRSRHLTAPVARRARASEWRTLT